MSSGDKMQTPSKQPDIMATIPKLNIERKIETSAAQSAAKLSTTGLNFFYGDFQALHGITMSVFEKRVTAFIGPSGCGKSTFLRTLNRMNENVRHSRVEGEILLDGQN